MQRVLRTPQVESSLDLGPVMTDAGSVDMNDAAVSVLYGLFLIFSLQLEDGERQNTPTTMTPISKLMLFYFIMSLMIRYFFFL